jgi:hypothetical protein
MLGSLGFLQGEFKIPIVHGTAKVCCFAHALAEVPVHGGVGEVDILLSGHLNYFNGFQQGKRKNSTLKVTAFV